MVLKSQKAFCVVEFVIFKLIEDKTKTTNDKIFQEKNLHCLNLNSNGPAAHVSKSIKGTS